jgi:hypothetical protein
MASVENATGRLLDAFFIQYACSFGYLMLSKEIVTRYGSYLHLPGRVFRPQQKRSHLDPERTVDSRGLPRKDRA